MAKNSKGGGRSHAFSWLLPSILLVGLSLLYSSLVWGQTTVGSLTGVVSDPTGAVIPGAKVVVTDANKGYD